MIRRSKLPSRADAFYARLAQAVASQPEAAARYGDLLAMMRRVQDRLAVEPVAMVLEGPEGDPIDFLFTRDHLQMISGWASDPARSTWILQLYATLDAGQTEMAQAIAQRAFDPGEPISLRAMSTLMDVASGVSPARLAQFEQEAARSLVGPYLNFPMPQLVQVWPEIDLGEDFREEAAYDGPVLLLTGTLDGRTFPKVRPRLWRVCQT